MLMGMMVFNNRQDQAINVQVRETELKLREQRQAQREEEEAKEAARKVLAAKDSFYQKLSDGIDVSILIIGDSIGAGSGASDSSKNWANLLKNHLQEVYDVKVTLKNVSMGGNASYAGYVRTMELDDGVEYDLAVICYGQNDSNTDFSLYYETILRAIRNKYKKCSIISILESSQKDYTEKMLTIWSLCEHYGVPIADTIAAYANSGKQYEELVTDGVHPNDEGHNIYFECVKGIIDSKANKYEEYNAADILPVNKNLRIFDNFKFYSVDDFIRTGLTYTLEVSGVSGVMGIDYQFVSGKNTAEIYVDGELLAAPTVTFNYDFSQRHILIVSNNCAVRNEIKVVFADKDQADGFNGIAFSWAE